MEAGFFFIGAVIGMIVGAVAAGRVAHNQFMPDVDRLNTIEIFGWMLAFNDGRWCVLENKPGGEMKVIGTTQATMREAIDRAMEIKRG